MTYSILPDAAPLPMTRRPECPFDPPDGFGELVEHYPLSRMAYSDGHVGWLATGHAIVRAVLADPRFSARHELMHYPFPGGADIKIGAAPVGYFSAMDAPEHTHYRRLLTGKFTARRMAQLSTRIEQISNEHLDAMERHGPPMDLMQAYAQPIPALTICEILGVPPRDQEMFQRVVAVNGLDATVEEVIAAMTAVQDYVRELVVAKRAEPTDDVLSDLTASDLTDEELAGVGTLVLASALDTTANMLGLGVFALLQHPDQFAALRAAPDAVDGAVEELLRYLSVLGISMRAALEDVEVGGQVIKAGETVTLSIQAANRDPERFGDPNKLDLSRHAVGHVAFGHGAHVCLGAQLARVEMAVGFRGLATRFPKLRLAVPAEDVPMRTGSIYGVQRLPVTWT